MIHWHAWSVRVGKRSLRLSRALTVSNMSNAQGSKRAGKSTAREILLKECNNRAGRLSSTTRSQRDVNLRDYYHLSEFSFNVQCIKKNPYYKTVFVLYNFIHFRYVDVGIFSNHYINYLWLHSNATKFKWEMFIVLFGNIGLWIYIVVGSSA